MILLQIYTALFAIALAYLNRVPCKKMMNYGASIREEKEWHRANAIIKLLWVLIWPLILLITGNGLVQCSLVFLSLHLVLWLVFDCALGWLLLDDPFYVGNTAKTDRLLRKVFKEEAGLWKLLIVSSVILVINFFL
jgi:hypothetical protein